ncbi:hypothetical protein Trisim1_004270 [Trichoderma cf. simile WF8]
MAAKNINRGDQPPAYGEPQAPKPTYGGYGGYEGYQQGQSSNYQEGIQGPSGQQAYYQPGPQMGVLFPAKGNTHLDKVNILAIINIHKANTCTPKVNILKANTLNNIPLKVITEIGVRVERQAAFLVV